MKKEEDLEYEIECREEGLRILVRHISSKIIPQDLKEVARRQRTRIMNVLYALTITPGVASSRNDMAKSTALAAY